MDSGDPVHFSFDILVQEDELSMIVHGHPGPHTKLTSWAWQFADVWGHAKPKRCHHYKTGKIGFYLCRLLGISLDCHLIFQANVCMHAWHNIKRFCSHLHGSAVFIHRLMVWALKSSFGDSSHLKRVGKESRALVGCLTQVDPHEQLCIIVDVEQCIHMWHVSSGSCFHEHLSSFDETINSTNPKPSLQFQIRHRKREASVVGLRSELCSKLSDIWP